ncbi:hypothetical protein LWI29_034749 [Acer saccharum]|uniref:MULE transposase domain-containing protein n=1 Tax=Acer saccharum TaxID=4024 RepID=A0AA39VW66_ACESA|nr:hypothetical protein LWI29_034749 [Acer saccharum]
MFVACCMDGNNQIYPLAFGYGDSENDASWSWFLTKLHDVIGEPPELVIISDRHKSIEKAVRTVFSNSLHGNCIFHLSQNIRAKFKNDKVQKFFFKAAKAYRVSEFESYMQEVSKVKADAVAYAMEAYVEKWARAHFPGRRYSIMTTNIAECLNSVLRDARELPVTVLTEYLRFTFQQWFHDRRIEAQKMNTYLTTFAHKMEVSRKERSLYMNAFAVGLLLISSQGQSLRSNS